MFSSLSCYFVKFVFFDDFVLNGAQLSTNWVSKERVEVSITLLHPGIMSVVEAAGEHFLRESDKIGRGCQVPVLVSPEFSGCADACLNLVDNHVDSQLRGQISHTLSKFSR